ncbi:MAG: DUF4349 domain-containing protein [Chloroflexi bacterium]|nr:DUF4349 domain-containing protein [Chloroflexota bacterium]
MKRKLLFAIVVSAFILAACGAAATEESRSYDALPEAPMQEQYAMEMPAPAATSAPSSAGNAAAVERIVIQNADLAVVVTDVEKRMKEIEKMAQDMEGFVVSSNLYQSYTNNYVKVPEAAVVIRVPSERLEEALELIKKDVVEVQNENRSGQDVTAEYVDLQSRLKNLEAAEAQLQKILDTAEKTEDVINVFNQLVYYREQIELVKGQIKYYDEAAALSAISVRLIAEETVQPVKVGPWEPKGVALEAVQDLVDFSKGFAEFLIRFVLYILPTWIMIGIPLYLVFLGGRAIFRRMRRNKPKKEQLPAPPVEK